VRKRSIRASFYPKNLQHPDTGHAAFGVISIGRDLAPSSRQQEEENAMQLVADRFVQHEDGAVFDSATGDRVRLTIANAGDASEQTRWVIRCDTLQKLQHRAIAPLVDFGMLGTTQRFEAWRCGAPWEGSRAEARCALDLAARFLCSISLTQGGESAERLRVGDGRPLVLPDESTGYPCASSSVSEEALIELPLHERGITIVSRTAVATLADIFQNGAGHRPHVVALWGPPGSGKTMVVRELARMARGSGFVPVAARLVDSRYAGLWQGRSLFIVDDASSRDGWPALLQSALRTSQQHVLLFVGDDEPGTVEGIPMDPIAPTALASAVHPSPADARLVARLRRAADEAHGLPGRFVRLLWEVPLSGRRSQRTGPASVSRVAERQPAYGVEDSVTEGRGPAPRTSTWPAPGELTTLRRRMDGAIRQLAKGRHEPGIRQLRQVIGGLARRDSWVDAGDGALTLAVSLLKRGRIRDAQEALDEVRQFAGRAGRNGLLVDAAVLTGETWIDRARLDEAESVLGAALQAARATGDALQLAKASLAIARCGFWRGRYADAAAALPTPTSAWPAELRLRHATLAARIAVGERDPGRAMESVSAALELSRGGSNPSMIAAASCAAAFVHLAVGDLGAVDRDVAGSIAAARSAHDPLRAIRARLLLAEAERRRARASTALAHLHRLTRSSANVPATLQARCTMIRDLIAAPDEAEAIVRRHTGATGLAALTLFTPGGNPGRSASDPLVSDIVGILRLCQTADDEGVVLKDVCARIRGQLHAAAVACVAVNGGWHAIASDGPRFEPAIAERAVAAGITIGPHLCDGRVEAAAPVHYGGTPIAAICVRWTLGSSYERSRAASVLAMAAAAAAPVVSSAIERRRRPPASGAGELLGVTAAMAELRQAAERAAAAPFSVLIEGESGSGKELVARIVHRAGPRRDRPFCALNCAALPDDLIEAELFGHARGSFTGAVADRPGVFEEAHGGTLFLDEVGELSARAQAKVLRTIQEGELRRLGENVSRRIDVRIVAATNRDLQQEADAGRFRRDLLYRLDVVRVTVPPLRDRREDIAVLTEHIWREAAARIGSRATLSASTVAALSSYHWPGNVRELQNVLAALAVRSAKRGVVLPSALPPQFGVHSRMDSWKLDEARRTFEEQFVRAALVRTGGHRSRAAVELGLTRQGLTKLMTRLGISEG
jgi:DNA-binding NtrC family response regulator